MHDKWIMYIHSLVHSQFSTFTTQFNRQGWVWKDSLEKIQLIETRNYLRRQESALHSEMKVL